MQGTLQVATWCHCLCLWWDPKQAFPGTGRVKVGGGVELLTVTLFPYSGTDGFTHWCNPSWSHMMFSEIHRRGDFPKNANKISDVHFAWPLLLSWIIWLIQNWRAWISQGGLFHPAMEEKTLALTWHCNVGHACCSTAAEQMWALPNGSVDGPERNNSLLYCHLSISPFFHFPPSPNPMRYETNAMAVKKCAGSLFCRCLLTSEPTEFRYLQHTQSSDSGSLKYALLRLLPFPLYVLDVHTAVELEGGDALPYFRLAVYETEF